MTEDRAAYAVPEPEPRTIIVHVTAPLVTVCCPECGKPLVRVTKGATVVVKCLRCKVWVNKQAA